MGDYKDSIIKWSTLHGYFSITDEEYDLYSGSYKVVPKAKEEQVLKTQNCILKEDVVIKEIPYYEVGNDSNGTTVYIAKEV